MAVFCLKELPVRIYAFSLVIGHNEDNEEAAKPEVPAEVGRRTVLIIVFRPDKGLIEENRRLCLLDMHDFFLCY